MVTQPLIGFEDTFPCHWRGERQLRDFNRLAFSGLPGGAALDDVDEGDFEAFKEFLPSLHPARSPRQSLDRVIVNEGSDIANAVNGQTLFENEPSLNNAFTCARWLFDPASNTLISSDDTFVVDPAAKANPSAAGDILVVSSSNDEGLFDISLSVDLSNLSAKGEVRVHVIGIFEPTVPLRWRTELEG